LLSLCRLHLLCVRQRREQRLSLGDLGRFRRRREAFDRRREDGVRFGGAAGRLVELGERERRAQFEAAGSLLFRDRTSKSGCKLRGASELRRWKARAKLGLARAGKAAG